MMKKVKLTKKQIEEALNVAVDVKNRDVSSAVRDAKVQTDKQIGAGKERNYVIAGDELNETENFGTEPKKYTKKQIEEARIKTIKKNNPCVTKKELTEMLNNNYKTIITESSFYDLVQLLDKHGWSYVDERKLNGKPLFVLYKDKKNALEPKKLIEIVKTMYPNAKYYNMKSEYAPEMTNRIALSLK